jgi:hypothetical protein
MPFHLKKIVVIWKNFLHFFREADMINFQPIKLWGTSYGPIRGGFLSFLTYSR